MCAHTASLLASLARLQADSSSMVRKHPLHRPLALSILHTPMQGDGTDDWGWMVRALAKVMGSDWVVEQVRSDMAKGKSEASWKSEDSDTGS